jgi:hypothetical protein
MPVGGFHTLIFHHPVPASHKIDALIVETDPLVHRSPSRLRRSSPFLHADAAVGAHRFFFLFHKSLLVSVFFVYIIKLLEPDLKFYAQSTKKDQISSLETWSSMEGLVGAMGVSFKMSKRRETGKETPMTPRISAMPHA